MRRRRIPVSYIPKSEIAEIRTTDGEIIKKKKILDGAHVRYQLGGELKIKTKTIEEKAIDMIGDDWWTMSVADRTDIIVELANEGVLSTPTTEMFAKGGAVAEKKETGHTVIYKLTDGKTITVDYETEQLMNDGIAEFYVSNDVESVEIKEKKPEEKKSLFDMAKKPEPKKSKSSSRAEVEIDGFESEIERFHELNDLLDSYKAERELIRGRLIQLGKEAFLEKYEEQGRKPDNFDLVDGEQKVLFMVQDKYLSVAPEKEALLSKYDDLLDVTETYSFNPKVLERVGDIVSKMILESKELSDDDKQNLLIKQRSVTVKKGTIERLMDYKNPEEIFELIQPTMALK